MRIAIISDIHGNLSALDAVLADLRSRPVDATYCLGDLVGYAAHPDEVTERIRAEDIPTSRRSPHVWSSAAATPF